MLGVVGALVCSCTTWFGDGAYDYTKASNLVYVRKQSTFAAGLRLVIVLGHRTGPAVNGMLATTWAFYKTGAFPRDPDHYLVYWGAHVAGAGDAGADARAGAGDARARADDADAGALVDPEYERERLGVVKLLLVNGSRSDATDADGRSAWELVERAW